MIRYKDLLTLTVNVWYINLLAIQQHIPVQYWVLYNGEHPRQIWKPFLLFSFSPTKKFEDLTHIIVWLTHIIVWHVYYYYCPHITFTVFWTVFICRPSLKRKEEATNWRTCVSSGSFLLGGNIVCWWRLHFV